MESRFHHCFTHGHSGLSLSLSLSLSQFIHIDSVSTPPSCYLAPPHNSLKPTTTTNPPPSSPLPPPPLAYPSRKKPTSTSLASTTQPQPISVFPAKHRTLQQRAHRLRARAPVSISLIEPDPRIKPSSGADLHTQDSHHGGSHGIVLVQKIGSKSYEIEGGEKRSIKLRRFCDYKSSLHIISLSEGFNLSLLFEEKKREEREVIPKKKRRGRSCDSLRRGPQRAGRCRNWRRRRSSR